MQEIKRDVLVNKASELLAAGTVDRVLGWRAGEFDYDVTPSVFLRVPKNLKKNLYGMISAVQISLNIL